MDNSRRSFRPSALVTILVLSMLLVVSFISAACSSSGPELTEEEKQAELTERYTQIMLDNASTEEEKQAEYRERYTQVMLNDMHDFSGAFIDFANIDLEHEVIRGDATSRVVLIRVSMKYTDTLEGIRETFRINEGEPFPEDIAITSVAEGMFAVDGSVLGFSLAPIPGFIGPKSIMTSDSQRNSICFGINKAYHNKFIFTFTANQAYDSDAASEVVFEGSASDLCSIRGFAYYEKKRSVVFLRPTVRSIDAGNSTLVVARISNLRPGGRVYIAKHSALNDDLVVGTAEFENIFTQGDIDYVALDGAYNSVDLGAPVYYVRRVSDKENQVVFIGILIAGNSSAMVVMPAEIMLEGLSVDIPYKLEALFVGNVDNDV